jgi:hypothetical protein
MEILMSDKAQVIERRYHKQCAICMLIDADAKDMKWHMFSEGLVESDDKYVCQDCLDGIRDIRKKCGHKADNPTHKIFEKYMPWFANSIPKLKETFEKQMVEIAP